MGRRDINTYAIRVFVFLMMLYAPLLTPHVSAQEATVIQHFIGSWEGQGELFGSKVSFRMEWEWVLGEKFVRLEFENGMQGPDGVDPILQAVAFYRLIGEGRLEGTWFDSRGMVLPLQASTEPTSCPSLKSVGVVRLCFPLFHHEAPRSKFVRARESGIRPVVFGFSAMART